MAFKRVKWKGILLQKNLLNSLKKKSLVSIKVYSRNSIITPKCIGKTFEVYNGFKFNKIVVNENMIGFKFGEFSPTRIKAVFKKSK